MMSVFPSFQEHKPEILQHHHPVSYSGNESLHCEEVCGRAQMPWVTHTGTQICTFTPSCPLISAPLLHVSTQHYYSPRCSGFGILFSFLSPLSSSPIIPIALTPSWLCTTITFTSMGSKSPLCLSRQCTPPHWAPCLHSCPLCSILRRSWVMSFRSCHSSAQNPPLASHHIKLHVIPVANENFCHLTAAPSLLIHSALARLPPCFALNIPNLFPAQELWPYNPLCWECPPHPLISTWCPPLLHCNLQSKVTFSKRPALTILAKTAPASALPLTTLSSPQPSCIFD